MKMMLLKKSKRLQRKCQGIISFGKQHQITRRPVSCDSSKWSLIKHIASYLAFLVIAFLTLYTSEVPTNYYLNDKSPEKFASIVNQIGLRVFSPLHNIVNIKKDQGKDGSFKVNVKDYQVGGVALSGDIVFQSKHFKNGDVTFSHRNFRSVVKKETSSIANLISKRELDHYFLFTNAPKTDVGEIQIKKLIHNEVKKKGMELKESNIQLFGKEYIEEFLDGNQDIVESLGLSPYQNPIELNSEKLHAVVSRLTECLDSSFFEISSKSSQVESVQDRMSSISMSEKNKLNNLSDMYYKTWKIDYDAYVWDIDQFFKDSKNKNLYRKYLDSVQNIKYQLLVEIRKNRNFEDILERRLFHSMNEDSLLKEEPRVVRLLFYYAYTNCDIGIKCSDQKKT